MNFGDKEIKSVVALAHCAKKLFSCCSLTLTLNYPIENRHYNTGS